MGPHASVSDEQQVGAGRERPDFLGGLFAEVVRPQLHEVAARQAGNAQERSRTFRRAQVACHMRFAALSILQRVCRQDVARLRALERGAMPSCGDCELARYGLGDRSFIAVCNLTNLTRKIDLEVYPDEISTGLVG